MKNLVAVCRPYFPPNVTHEILEEFRPLMCPMDVTMVKAMSYLEMFLPTYNTVETRSTTFDLWFDELMGFWEACPNLPLFETSLMALFTRLADHTMGHIDWSKFIPMFMTRIVQHFDLPVRFKNVQMQRANFMDLNLAARLMTALMTSNPEIFVNLNQLFSALDSYFHSANVGRHSMKLVQFLFGLVSNFVNKIYKERFRRRKSWGAVQIPEEKKISNDQITTFVSFLMPVVLNGMYFKASLLFEKILQNLASMRPELVIAPVMERLFTAFDTLTEPHKLTANMSSVCSMARSIVNPEAGCKEAPTQVII